MKIHCAAIHNHEKERINGLIEILRKGIDKKLNNPSAMMFKRKIKKRKLKEFQNNKRIKIKKLRV